MQKNPKNKNNNPTTKPKHLQINKHYNLLSRCYLHKSRAEGTVQRRPGRGPAEAPIPRGVASEGERTLCVSVFGRNRHRFKLVRFLQLGNMNMERGGRQSGREGWSQVAGYQAGEDSKEQKRTENARQGSSKSKRAPGRPGRGARGRKGAPEPGPGAPRRLLKSSPHSFWEERLL